MDNTIQEAVDAHMESIAEGIFREECHTQKRRLEEMEAMFWPMPHLWKELAQMANDPKQHLNKHQNA